MLISPPTNPTMIESISHATNRGPTSANRSPVCGWSTSGGGAQAMPGCG